MNEWLAVDPDDATVEKVRNELKTYSGSYLDADYPEGAIRTAQNIVTRLHPAKIQHISHLFELSDESEFEHLIWGEAWGREQLPDDPERLRRRRDALLHSLHGLALGYRVTAYEDGNYAEEVRPLLGIIAAAKEEHDVIVAVLADASD